MNIGIFDSGRGGRFVASKLRQLLPDHTYTVVDDAAHAPYGERSFDDIERLTHAAVQPLLEMSDIIVLACNTATAAAIDSLRATYPNKTFVGFEPMIKTAGQISKTGHVTLLATQATAESDRTAQLIANYGPELKIDKPNTVGWAAAIDRGLASEVSLSELEISIADGSDTVVIACTHYIDLIPRIESLTANISVIEPSEAIARRISQLAAELPQQTHRPD